MIKLFSLAACGVALLTLAAACDSTVDESDDDALCAGYADEAANGNATIRFRNDSPIDIYLPASCGPPSPQIERADGSFSDVNWDYDGSCLQTCDNLQSESRFECGACQAVTYLVPAGGTLDVTWDGGGLLARDMPASCWFEPSQSGSCGQIVAAEEAAYNVSITGYDACVGECTCDANGMCLGDADTSGQQAPSQIGTLNFASDSMVEVVFDMCVFGCP